MDTDNKKLVMYIFVNKDLDMTKGKTSSQVAHITQQIVEEIIRQGYEIYPPPESYFTYMKWKSCCTMIILKASENELGELMKRKDSRPFFDEGRTTQVRSGSLTVVGFLPCEEKEEFGNKYFQLL